MMEITKDLFEQQRHPRFGAANPERMNLEFWEWMIRGDDSLPLEVQEGLAAYGWSLQDGKLKSSYGPYRARQMFNAPICDGGPIWTFERMGATQTNLPDGRMVCVGGEHEDFYDPDFCIYNDVVVLGAKGEIEIYGFPKEIFRPTDFHTATLLGDQIVIVGGLGYKDERKIGYTPVYKLDISDYHIEEIVSSGEMPGWIFKHSARLVSNGVIVVQDGEIIRTHDGEERYRQNVEEFSLDAQSGMWRQLTHRNWRQFRIRAADKKMFLDKDRLTRPKLKQLLPTSVDHYVLSCDWIGARIRVREVPVSVNVGISDVKILLEGDLAADLTERLVEDVRANTERVLGRPCEMDEL